MGPKMRLSSYCTKRGDNTVNLVTSRKTNARLAHPICSLLLQCLGNTDKRTNVLYAPLSIGKVPSTKGAHLQLDAKTFKKIQ